MTTTLKVLIPAKIAEAAQTTQYTSSTGQTLIDKFTATAFVGGETISVAIISAAAPVWDNANIVVRDKLLQTDECYTFPELVGRALGLGDYIATEASNGNAINIASSGRIVT